MMHPSFLYDNSSATNDRAILEKTYNYYYSHIQTEYKNDIKDQMTNAYQYTLWLAGSYAIRPGGMDYHMFFEAPPKYPTVKMNEENRDKLSGYFTDPEIKYNDINFHMKTKFTHTQEEYLENASSNINLVMSIIDCQKKHWFISLFEGVADAITGGYYSRFTDWVGKKWEGFWNDFIIYDLWSITVGEVTMTPVKVVKDGKLLEHTIAKAKGEDTSDYEEDAYDIDIDIDYTYDLKDLGIGYYADKTNLTPEDKERAVEMANYLGDLFDSHSDSYFGWYVQGGYHTGSYQGGSVGTNITRALKEVEDKVEEWKDVDFDASADPQIFPIQGFTEPPTSSPYGPRNYPPDPYHTGVDFAAPMGTPILSAADGMVLFTGWSPGAFGNYITVLHGYHNGEPVITMYAHMSAFGSYNQGDPVKKGDTIGYIGSTGESTGPHLHFEYFEGTTRYNPAEKFDMLYYLRPRN